MAKLLEIYKCELCGNVIEVMHAGDGELVCCGQPMKLQAANTVDAAQEKHLPVIEKNDMGILVKVGAIAHPMEEKHYIEWVEGVSEDGRVCREALKPGQKPQVQFNVACNEGKVRAYCNLHGLWEVKV